jgi:hypothetical protein
MRILFGVSGDHFAGGSVKEESGCRRARWGGF